ncbi:MAG: glycosyltransferase family 39 protein [Hymenobacter sp.]
MEQTTPTSRVLWGWLALAAGLLGAGLRLWQWQLGTSFFLDELAVLHNLASRPAAQLLSQPLADAQVAPPLFLLLEKACLVGLGRSELALRLPALLAGLAALPLLWAVARRVLAAPLVPLALLTFAVGFTFIYYGAQVKQYAGDVAATLLVQWLALRPAGGAAPTPACGWARRWRGWGCRFIRRRRCWRWRAAARRWWGWPPSMRAGPGCGPRRG